MDRGEISCPECGGEGIVVCGCGEEVTCDECLGIGVDPDIIDVESFKKAEKSILDKCFADGPCGTWELLNGDRWVGRTGGKHGSILYADFKWSTQNDE